MLRKDILEDCLIELPPFGSFPVRGFSKAIELLSEKDPDTLIYEDDDRSKKIIGLVYTMPDGRQVYIWRSGLLGLEYSEARYLMNAHRDIKLSKHDKPLQPRSKLGQLGDRLPDAEQNKLRQLANWAGSHQSLPERKAG